MKRWLFFLSLQIFIAGDLYAQSFTVDELITLANLPSKSILSYMKKKGFVLSGSTSDSVALTASFTTKYKYNREDAAPKRNLNIAIRDNSKCYILQTSALSEYIAGERSLIKAGFFYDTLKDISNAASMVFQKANMCVKASSVVEEGIPVYSFELKVSAVPTSILYAEDLLQFNSHHFLASYFGAENVRKDLFYISENELKRCTVLFSGTRRQVLFVWEDEINLSTLAYIIVTNSLPTEGAKKNDPLPGNNEWKLQNGVGPGMALKELLKINEIDFDIYGKKSELAFLVRPNDYGKIDFKKTAIMLSCPDCFDNKIFNQPVVSALDIAKANLPMRVFDIVIYPSRR